MTEQQRREQILKQRQLAMQERPAGPAPMTDQEAERIASQNGQALTQEQLVAVALLGKFVQNDINGIKKLAGDGIKIRDVDMSKVMPSGIIKATGGIPRSVPSRIETKPPVLPPPIIELPGPPPTSFEPRPIQSIQPVIDDGQMNIEFRKANFQDVIDSVERLEKQVNILTESVNILIAESQKKN